MTKIEQLLQKAERLPKDQRLTLAHRLLASSEPAASKEVERAWDLEIRGRIQRYDRGQARSRSASKVFADLDRRLAR